MKLKCICLRDFANDSIAIASLPGVFAANCETALAINISEQPGKYSNKSCCMVPQVSINS